MEKEILSFVEFCKDHIVEHLEDWEGDTVDAGELGWKLTEGMNADGTFTKR